MLRAAAALTAAAVALAGCGTDDADSSTSVVPKSAVLSITHTGPVPIVEAEVATDDGVPIQRAPFVCGSGERCLLELPAVPPGEPLVIRFLDRAGQLADAWIGAAPPGEFASLRTSPAATGLHLFKLMARDGGIDPNLLAEGLAATFSDIGGDSASSDPLGLLGLHVRDRLAQGTSTEREILDALRIAILAGERAPGSRLPPPARAPGPPTAGAGAGAGAETGSGCPAALGLFFKGLSAASMALPYPVVGGIFYQADAIYAEGCDDTGAKLDAIAAQLDQLQARMEELKLGLAELAQLLSDANAKTVLARMRDDVGALDGLIDAYNMVTIRETPGFTYRSLRDYLDADGRSGLDASTYTGNVRRVIDQADSARLLLNTIANPERLQLLASAIDAICARAESIPQEIVATRIKCNAMILQAVSFVVASHTQARVMLEDVYLLLERTEQRAQTDPALASWLSGRFVQPDYRAGDRWTDTSRKVRARIDANMVDAVRVFRGPASGVYELYDGLPAALRADLRALYCDVESPVPGERPSTLRGIKAWWIAGQAAPFIETHCDPSPNPIIDGGLAPRKIVRSRLLYQASDRVFGVLGVPVVRDLPAPSSTYTLITQAELQARRVRLVWPVGTRTSPMALTADTATAPAGGTRLLQADFASLRFLSAFSIRPDDGWTAKGFTHFDRQLLGTDAFSGDTLYARYDHSDGYSYPIQLSLKASQGSYTRFAFAIFCVSRDCQRKDGTPLEGGALAFRPAGAVPPAAPPAELTFARAGGLEVAAGFNTVPVWVLRVDGVNRVP